MIKNPSYRSNVLINEQKNPGAKTTRNPHAVDNVNQGMGPRTGNHGMPAKRNDFISAKAERSDLADSINRAYALRSPTSRSQTKTTIDPTLEGVASDVDTGFKKRRK